MKDKLLFALKIIALPLALLLQLIVTILVAPLVLLGNYLAKGTPREFNSDKKELLFGKRIVRSMAKLKEKGYPVKLEKVGKQSIYKVANENFTLEVNINTDWFGMEYTRLVKGRKYPESKTIDTDLYPISEPDQYGFAKEIEAEIVEFLGSIPTYK